MRLNALWFAALVSASSLSSLPNLPAETISSNAGRGVTASDSYIFTRAAPTTTLRVVPSSLRTVDDDEEDDSEPDTEKSCAVQLEALKMLYKMKVDQEHDVEDELARVTKLYEAEQAKSASANKQYETCNNDRKDREGELGQMKGRLADMEQNQKITQESCLRDIVTVENQMRELQKKTKQLQEEVERGPGPFPCNPEQLLCHGANSPICRQMGCCN